MNLDIETRHVLMRSEWHRMIEDWLARSATAHADLAAVDLTLQHEQAGDRVEAIARIGGRTVRAGAAGGSMTTVLHEALAALARELEACPDGDRGPRAPQRAASSSRSKLATSVTKRCTEASATRWPISESSALPTPPSGGV